jgi:NAD(P)H-dependent FMN reductase
MTTRILVLIGSLRAGSYNRGLAEAAVKQAPEGTDVEIFEGLGEVPFYNEDLDRAGDVPDPARALRDAVQRADALLVVTPEYNGSPPAGLKNAVDWISRPFGGGAIIGKPVAVVGTSRGRIGGVWSHEYTLKISRIAGARVLDDVALCVPHAAERFATTHPADDGEVATALFDVLVTLAAAAGTTTEASRGDDAHFLRTADRHGPGDGLLRIGTSTGTRAREDCDRRVRR